MMPGTHNAPTPGPWSAEPTDAAPSVVEQFALAQAHARIVGGPPALIRLSRYVLLERLGAGGMGTVFSAYDPQLDRRLAIKVVHPGNATSRASDRLAREARALAKLSHPNIVTVFDAGVVGSEVFIAMELLTGRNLVDWCNPGRTWRQVRDLLLSAARGLSAAHGAGLVHRDFKPANVQIGDDNTVRVLDFGLARSVDEVTTESGGHSASSQLSTLTTVGNLMGTPAYMAPEQLLHGVSNARSDQFSFFVTFYEALYGTRPCPSGDLPGLVRSVSKMRLPESPPRRGVPAWLHRAILRGLSLRPEDRFPSMQAVIDQLQSDRSARRRGAILAFVGVLATAAIGAASARALGPEASAGDTDPVAEMTTRAREAAARSYFIYGPVDDPEHPTAFQIVVELEALDGPNSVASQAATQLRAEFADTLVRLGDHFWEREGGAPFSADYYAMALVFDPERARPRERTSLTLGELKSLTARAAAGRFSEAERLAGESLAALAEPDAKEQARRVASLAERERAPSPSTLARLTDLVDADILVIEDDDDSEPQPAPEPTHSGRRPPVETATPTPPTPPPTTPTRESKQRAKALAADAARAANAGDLDRAERLYREALNIRASSPKALAGLARLSFDRGSYSAALQYARRAAKASPRSRDVQILLGDVAFRVHYYDEARRAYVAAQGLGSKLATSRMTYLESKVGKQ